MLGESFVHYWLAWLLFFGFGVGGLFSLKVCISQILRSELAIGGLAGGLALMLMGAASASLTAPVQFIAETSASIPLAVGFVLSASGVLLTAFCAVALLIAGLVRGRYYGPAARG